MHILGLALAIVGSLLATTAGAQTSCAPDGRPIDPYYERPGARSGLLLGFAGLSAKQLHAATRLLGACLTDAAER